MGNCLMCERERIALNHGHGKPIFEKGRPNVKFEDLPEDVLGTILSKLPPREVLKTSVFSSKWRYMWAFCPKLSFNGVAACGRNSCEQKQYNQNFVDHVNAVLQKYHGKVVEELQVKFELDSMLVDHLNNWVRFAVSSWTKNLAFDLAPIKFGGRDDRYIFPFELLDSESISRLQCIQLSFVSFKPPSQFGGFPNLRKLDLNLLCVTRKDLENMLSNCCSLEWLSMVRCHLNDELRVDRPLSRLVYLQVVNCVITKIEFDAMRLSTFVYKGQFVPIVLNNVSKLANANIFFFKAVFQTALAALLNDHPNIQNLTLRILFQQLETQWHLDNPHILSQLRNLQLLLHIFPEEIDKVLYLASFLRATPFIEKLEVHFGSGHELWFAKKGPVRCHLSRCEYGYLKNMHITGYKGARGQLEFLLHIVENAPALEVLTVDTTQILHEEFLGETIDRSLFYRAGQMARYHLSQKLSPKVKLYVI